MIQKHLLKRLILAMVMSFTLPVLANSVTSDTISRLTILVKNGNYEAAYALAKAHENELAGDTQFDMLLGEAALHTHHPDEASFAFERVLVIQPNNYHASLELERAYTLLGYKPDTPIGVLRSAYIGLSAGYDSNINLSPDSKFFTAAIGSPFVIPADNVDVDAAFATLLLGGQIKKIFDNNFGLFAAGNGYFRRNLNHRFANYETMRAEVGASKGIGAYEFSLPVSGEEIVYGGDIYRRSIAAAAEISRTFVPNRILSGLIEYRTFTFGHLTPASIRLLTYAGKWLEFVPAIYDEIDTRVYFAKGISMHVGDQFLARSFFGGQIVNSFKKNPERVPFIALDLQKAIFNGIDPNFLIKRRDYYMNISVGIIFQLSKNFFLQPDFNYAINHSNITLNSYKQRLVKATLLYNIV